MGACRSRDGLGRDARWSSLRGRCRGSCGGVCAGGMVGSTSSNRCAAGPPLCWSNLRLVGSGENRIHVESTHPRGSDLVDRARRRGRDTGKTRRGSPGSRPGERRSGAVVRAGSRRRSASRRGPGGRGSGAHRRRCSRPSRKSARRPGCRPCRGPERGAGWRRPRPAVCCRQRRPGACCLSHPRTEPRRGAGHRVSHR